MGRVATVLDKLGIKFVRKTGAGSFRLWASCPYHVITEVERAAKVGMRWMIRENGERAGQHFCFSCKAGGSLADLVMHVRGVAFDGAADWLNDFGDATPDPVPMAESIALDLWPTVTKGFRIPREVIFDSLPSWVTPARRYLHARGIDEAQCHRWGIGYAVDGRLAGRIVLVVRSARGPAGYMARTYSDQTRRYLYPRGDEKPDLDVMFGQENWSGRREVVVTEGALNALAVERAVGGNIAALGGSDIREMHVARLVTFARVVILTDSDKAGDEVASNLMGMLGRHTLAVRVRLPDNVDANDLTTPELRDALWPALSPRISNR